MPNTPRSSNSGRFVKASSAAGKRAQAGPSIKSYFTPVGTSKPASLPSRHVVILDEELSTTFSPIEVSDSVGRPPTKLSLQPGNVVHETTNGVTTILAATETASTTSPSLSLSVINHAKLPATPSKTDEKRVLRSKDGSSRVTSELVRFFADYEEIVFGTPKEPAFLNSDTRLYIIDKKNKEQGIASAASQIRPQQASRNEIPDSQEEPAIDDAQQCLPQTETVDLSIYKKEAAALKEDPLGDSLYVKPHRRAERKEKQLRNIEKEHALHEKAELEKLLDDLRGSEWLRAMGVTGVADTDRKKYMIHRDYFINRVVALLDKFTAWKDQEKEMRARREEAQAAREEVEDDELDVTINSRAGSLSSFATEADPSAKQLQVEARLATAPVRKITLKLSKPVVVAPLEPEKPFTSFYNTKPQLREAAMGKSRRGRNMTAFGLPLPDSKEKEFALPDDFVSEEAIISNARKRRRLKRESQGTGL